MKNLMILAAGLFALGCVDAGTKDSGGGTTVADPTFSVTWGGSSVDLSITDGSGSYFFGMAETGATCSADPSQCWTGEDCIFGFGDFLYCHPAGATGASLAYGGDFAALNEGSETVFFDNSFDGSVTYYIEFSDGSCGSFGHDTSYYSSMGCDAL